MKSLEIWGREGVRGFICDNGKSVFVYELSFRHARKIVEAKRSLFELNRGKNVMP